MSDVEHHGGISRRALVKSTAIGSLALAAGGISLPFGLKSAAAAVQQAVNPLIKWSGVPVRLTAAAAAPCDYTSKTTKFTGSKPTTPVKTFTAITRFAPACAAAQYAAELTILIDSTTR